MRCLLPAPRGAAWCGLSGVWEPAVRGASPESSHIREGFRKAETTADLGALLFNKCRGVGWGGEESDVACGIRVAM